ncbi:MAG: metallophosphoesterase [Clostridia bacterium]|nr:metallophosphoesterase [Clostridia bacterium]MDH7572708.1 metallophosphoesterase [Clostridia bacterium]
MKIVKRRVLSALWGTAVAAAVVIYSLARTSSALVVERVDLHLPGLPPGLEGLTIVHLSDLHYGFGHFRRQEAVSRLLEMVGSLRPELIVFTGDLLDRTADPRLPATRPFAGLSAPLGVYAVLGNHDHRFGPDVISRSLETSGVRVLTNRSLRLERNGTGFWLAGIDDPLTGHPDLSSALAGVPEGEFTILLVHAPDVAPRAAQAGIDLQLSGHSHGGQIRLPGERPVYTPPLSRRYPCGLRRVPGTDTQVYTSRGLGTTALPFRLFCPPEIALLILHRGSGQSGSVTGP